MKTHGIKLTARMETYGWIGFLNGIHWFAQTFKGRIITENHAYKGFE